MELIIGLVAVVIIVAVILATKKNSKAIRIVHDQSKENRFLQESLEWLEKRWQQAIEEKEAGELKTFPHWFCDDVTERQLNRISRMGLEIEKGKLTKGEASDIIGLFEPPDESDIDVINYFKKAFNLSTKGMNQTRASHIVAILFQDPENQKAYETRPASAMQKEFFKYFDLKIPKGLAHDDANTLINDYTKQRIKEDKYSMDNWLAYENIFDEINDPYMREDYEIKKVSLSMYREVMSAFKKEGNNLSDLEEDIDAVVDKIKEMHPEIKR